MSKKVCILNGSPRLHGNTKELIKRFTKGAEEAGCEVVCFDLQQMNIHGCLGCCGGGKPKSTLVSSTMTWTQSTQPTWTPTSSS